MTRAASLLAAAALTLGCRERISPHPAPHHGDAPPRRVVSVPLPSPSADAGVDAAAAQATPADVRSWPFVAHARRWCLPDRLASTSYLARWVPQFHGRLPEGDPVPAPGRFLPGQRAVHDDVPTREDNDRMLAWQATPRASHVMDCVVRLPIPGADRDRSSTYAIYLPADYLDHPERPRAVLVLVSGGNGNRTRWFLTPSRSDGETPGTGGLEVRRRVDAWARAHPGATVPIVVGLDGTSDQFPNGMAVFLQRELPEHLLATYLPSQPRGRVAFGVECISSGCAELMQSLRGDPASYHVVGLLSPYVHPSGIDVNTSFGNGPERAAFFQTLVDRHRLGIFELRFSVGNLDSHLPRARALYDRLQRAGLYPSADPTYADCQYRRARPTSSHCTATWPGFWLYPNVAHHYRALIPAFPPALDWQLTTLVEVTDRLQHGARSPGAPSDAGVAQAVDAGAVIEAPGP